MCDLINKLKLLVHQERDLVAEILRHLREVEARQLYLEHGYPSMFAFCCECLGYSEPEAHIRIQAMRLIRAVPEVEQKIESGELSLSVAAKAQGCFRRENVGKDRQTKIVERLVGKSTRQAARELAALFPDAPKPEVERPVSQKLTRIEFTVTATQLAKFHRLKDLLAHKNFEGRYDLLFEELADMALAKFDAPVLSARKVQTRRTRYIPAVTRKQVWAQAQGRCQFRSEDGHRCSSTFGLQIDHIHAYARGGGNAPDNLQLLCGAHNRWRSRSA